MSISPQHSLQSTSAAPQTIEALVSGADIEIIPFRGVEEKLGVVPPGTTLTVTCSPKFGLERTLEYSELAAKAGFRVVPHLAARQVADEPELRRFAERLGEAGVTDLYVIGGDASQPVGPYSSAVEVLEALAVFEHGFRTIGVACYPEGHPHISDPALLDALRRKQSLADYMVNQLCFSGAALITWLRQMRAVGFELPLHIGLAGPLEIRKLIEVSLRSGAGSSISFLKKQHGFIGNLLRPGSYRPEELLADIERLQGTDDLGIRSVHLFSFNHLANTVDWQRRISGGPDSVQAAQRSHPMLTR